jgi:acetyltransferase-like isoleucine patch superfamily enzyme
VRRFRTLRGYVRQNGLRVFLWVAFELFVEKTLTAVWTSLFGVKCWCMGVSVGRDVEVFGNCIIRKHPLSTIAIGDRVQLISSSWRSSTANCHASKLRTFSETSRIVIGDNSGMTGCSIIARSKTIRVGTGCMLAAGVKILDSDFHIVWPPEKRHNTWQTDMDQDVTLEDNVWVGMEAIILKGVRIGQNSVIGAGSVVVSDVPPNCLAAGNPARILKRLDT